MFSGGHKFVVDSYRYEWTRDDLFSTDWTVRVSLPVYALGSECSLTPSLIYSFASTSRASKDSRSLLSGRTRQ